MISVFSFTLSNAYFLCLFLQVSILFVCLIANHELIRFHLHSFVFFFCYLSCAVSLLFQTFFFKYTYLSEFINKQHHNRLIFFFWWSMQKEITICMCILYIFFFSILHLRTPFNDESKPPHYQNSNTDSGTTTTTTTMVMTTAVATKTIIIIIMIMITTTN